MNKVVHFEIVAEDVERAIVFYTNVFGWEIKKFTTPEVPEGMGYWIINTTSANTPGAINGGLRKEMGIEKKTQTVSVNGFINTIAVANIDEATTKIEGNSGKIMQSKMQVPGIGWLAYCLDSEGNMFSVLQPEMQN